jgi:ribosome biogenesis GTPase A
MVNFWRIVNYVIREADIILLILDARFPEQTRNREIELKVKKLNKKLLYILNKSDLIPLEDVKSLQENYRPCVFVSSKDRLGGTMLFKKIMELSRGKECSVGVLGFPNVGKSSVINLLKGQKSASVSSQAGHTRGIQFVKAKGKIKLIDTPGVLQFKEKDLLTQVLIGSYNPQNLREPDYYAMLIIDKYPELFENYYSMKYNKDPQEFLEEIATKRNVLIKGGKPDIVRMARNLLSDWQRGLIHEKLFKKANITN